MNYQKKLSGPILDRIDIHINVPSVEVEKLAERSNTINGETTAIIKERVKKARQIQEKRFAGLKGIHANADMKNRQLKELIRLDDGANLLLKQAVVKYSLSARTYFRLIKVAQTIADLSAKDSIKSEHVAEALQYRMRSQYE